MEQIKITKLNNSECKLTCSPSVLNELSEIFSFYIQGAKFHPKVKAKKWDGKIRLINSRKSTIPFGLLFRLKKYCELNEYAFESDVDMSDNEFSLEEAQTFVSEMNLPFPIRDYQLNAFVHAIKKQRAIVISPTGSGKSFILFIILKFLRELDRKILLIVPTVNLVEQMNQDFFEYAVNTDPLDVQLVYSGKTTAVSSPIMISTWQSLQRLDKEWFSQFDAVIVDETHLATGNTLQKILEHCVNADFRLGMTGTLSGDKIDEMMLVAAIGEPKKIISTTELIEQNYLSDLKIKCLIFKHNLPYNKITYQEEIDYLISNEQRNKSIINLTSTLKGNTLVLFNYVEKHGTVLYEMLLNKNLNKNIFFISGETKSEIRENIRQQVKSESADNIIVASSGVFSTGVNIPSLHNVIFSSPTKSRVRVLQSVGRILRQHQSKDIATVYDLSDKLFQKRTNYTFSHFEQRYQYYLEENFDIQYYELNLN